MKNDKPGPWSYELTDGHGYVSVSNAMITKRMLAQKFGDSTLQSVNEKDELKSTYKIKGYALTRTKRQND